MTAPTLPRICPLFAVLLPCAAAAQPVLPDWTQATFDSSSGEITNELFPQPEGLVSIFDGFEGEVVEHIESFATFRTKSILGVDTRVVREETWEDDLLVETAFDWFAQDTDGNVWYFGEWVNNYHYDDDGNIIDVDHEGSWKADGIVNLPGMIMWAEPMVGMEYYQEFAPGVALDFAVVNALDDVVDIPFGHFTDVLNTSEGNLIDGPELVENKLYAPDVGLVLIQVLDDDGEPEFEVPLIDQYYIPAPSGAALFAAGALGLSRRRR
jgi:hypothetical protein